MENNFCSHCGKENKPLSEEANRLLSDVYGKLWTEAYYDPTNDTVRAFAKPLADKMMELNKILKFKR